MLKFAWARGWAIQIFRSGVDWNIQGVISFQIRKDSRNCACKTLLVNTKLRRLVATVSTHTLASRDRYNAEGLREFKPRTFGVKSLSGKQEVVGLLHSGKLSAFDRFALSTVPVGCNDSLGR